MGFTISVTIEDEHHSFNHQSPDAKSAANYIGGQMASHSDSPASSWQAVKRGLSQAMLSPDGLAITLRPDDGEDPTGIFEKAFALAAEIRRAIG